MVLQQEVVAKAVRFQDVERRVFTLERIVADLSDRFGKTAPSIEVFLVRWALYNLLRGPTCAPHTRMNPSPRFRKMQDWIQDDGVTRFQTFGSAARQLGSASVSPSWFILSGSPNNTCTWQCPHPWLAIHAASPACTKLRTVSVYNRRVDLHRSEGSSMSEASQNFLRHQVIGAHNNYNTVFFCEASLKVRCAIIAEQARCSVVSRRAMAS